MAAIIELNGIPGAYARVTLPRCGRRQAQVVLSAQEPFQEGQKVELMLGGVKVLTGVVWRVGEERSLPKLWLHDAAGLQKELPGKFYRGATESLVARDILSESGHQGEVNLPSPTAYYNRMAGPGTIQLSDLLEAGNLWRTQASGQLYVGPETWKRGVRLEWGETLTGVDPLGQTLTAVLTPEAEPGTVAAADPNGEDGAFRVQRVQHLVSEKEVTTILWI